MQYTKYLFTKEKHLQNDFDPSDDFNIKNKEEGIKTLTQNVQKLAELQDKFFAHNKHGLVIILQGMDASGKDGILKHVISGLNPLGCIAKSFSTPNAEEFSHDYMWRCIKNLPPRGHIGIFNRSYYEEVLIVRIHPQFLNKQNLPYIPQNEKEFDTFFENRFTDINNFEKYLNNNGFHVIKFFLNISKEEQKRRFMKRIKRSAKNWKFKPDDIEERKYWDEYIKNYNDMFKRTSTEHAPWYIIPSNKKWVSRNIICNILINKLESLDIHYPNVTYEQKRKIIEAKHILEKE